MQTQKFIVWTDDWKPAEVQAINRREAAEVFASGLIEVPHNSNMRPQLFFVSVARPDARGGIHRFSVSVSLTTQCLTTDVDEE